MRIISSTYRPILCSLSPTVMPLMCKEERMDWANGSMHKENTMGDSGHP